MRLLQITFDLDDHRLVRASIGGRDLPGAVTATLTRDGVVVRDFEGKDLLWEDITRTVESSPMTNLTPAQADIAAALGYAVETDAVGEQESGS